jgi:hypothetical protein
VDWQVLERGLRDDPIEQSRQSHIKNEEVHPGEPGIRNRLEFSAAKPEENQAEKRQRQIDDFEHAGCLPADLALVNLSAPARKSGLAKRSRSPYRRRADAVPGNRKLGLT